MVIREWGRARATSLLVVGAASILLATAHWSKPETTTDRWEYVCGPFHLDTLSISMAGPAETRSGIALSQNQNELLWLTGYQVLAADSSRPEVVQEELLCHNNLYLDGTVAGYRHLLGTRVYGSPRLFTVAQGGDEIVFPDGFAIPVPARQRLQMTTQVLSLLPENMGRNVEHRIRSEFIRDSDLARKPTPLFLVEAAGTVVLHDPRSKGPTGEKPAAETFSVDRTGRVRTGHWLVPPGEHTNTTRVTRMMALPFDTTAHYISSHLHPYARWQELRDLTTGQVVHRAEARSTVDGRSLAEVTNYGSPTGKPLFVGHEYELVTHYANTSAKPVTAMSMLFLYCHDKEFTGYDPRREVKEEPTASSPSSEEFCAPDLARLKAP